MSTLPWQVYTTLRGARIVPSELVTMCNLLGIDDAGRQLQMLRLVRAMAETEKAVKKDGGSKA